MLLLPVVFVVMLSSTFIEAVSPVNIFCSLFVVPAVSTLMEILFVNGCELTTIFIFALGMLYCWFKHITRPK